MDGMQFSRCDCHTCTQARAQERLGVITGAIYGTKADAPETYDGHAPKCGDHVFIGNGKCKCGYWTRYPGTHV